LIIVAVDPESSNTFSKILDLTEAMARLPNPVFRNLFFGSKKPFLAGFLRISFFPAFSGGIFHKNVVLERSQEFRFFSILQEFFAGISVGRNSCIFSGFLRIPPDSCSHEKLSGVGQRLKKALC
jgi:hypothetical protein